MLEWCEEVLFFTRAKQKLLEYIIQCVDAFALSLSGLLGPAIAACLLGMAGGLENLKGTPNRKLPSLGTKKELQTGFARNTRRNGILFRSELCHGISNAL